MKFCRDLTGHVRNVPAWTSHGENERFHFSLNRRNHVFVRKFVVVLAPQDLGDMSNGAYLSIARAEHNAPQDTCALWQGRVGQLGAGNGQDTGDDIQLSELVEASIVAVDVP